MTHLTHGPFVTCRSGVYFKRPLSARSDRFEVNLAKLSSFGILYNQDEGPDFRTDVQYVIRQGIMAFRGCTEPINPLINRIRDRS